MRSEAHRLTVAIGCPVMDPERGQRELHVVDRARLSTAHDLASLDQIELKAQAGRRVGVELACLMETVVPY